MEMHQHDSAACFRFVLRGEVTQEDARQLWSAWETAQSITNGRPVVVEVSGITKADAGALEVLIKMQTSGIAITAIRPVVCSELLRCFDLPSDTSRAGRSLFWPIRMLKAIP